MYLKEGSYSNLTYLELTFFRAVYLSPYVSWNKGTLEIADIRYIRRIPMNIFHSIYVFQELGLVKPNKNWTKYSLTYLPQKQTVDEKEELDKVKQLPEISMRRKLQLVQSQNEKEALDVLFVLCLLYGNVFMPINKFSQFGLRESDEVMVQSLVKRTGVDFGQEQKVYKHKVTVIGFTEQARVLEFLLTFIKIEQQEIAPSARTVQAIQKRGVLWEAHKARSGQAKALVTDFISFQRSRFKS